MKTWTSYLCRCISWQNCSTELGFQKHTIHYCWCVWHHQHAGHTTMGVQYELQNILEFGYEKQSSWLFFVRFLALCKSMVFLLLLPWLSRAVCLFVCFFSLFLVVLRDCCAFFCVCVITYPLFWPCSLGCITAAILYLSSCCFLGVG